MENKNYALHEVAKFDNFRQMLDMAASEAGNKIAYMFRKDGIIESVTFDKFNATTKALGSAICALGMGEEHIAMCGENSYEWITVFFTVLAGRSVFVPVDQGLPFSEIMHIINESETKVFFYSGKFEKDVLENRENMPNVKYFVNVNKEATDESGEYLSLEGMLSRGKKLLKDGYGDYFIPQEDDSKIKSIVYTSGTTGTSKGVMLTLHNLVYGINYGMRICTVYERGMSVLPYHHTYESSCDLIVSMHKHATVCINENLRMVAQNLKTYKPDYIMLVPLFVENFYKKIWKSVKEQGKEEDLKKAIKLSNALRKIGIDKRKQIFKSVTDVFGGNLKKIVSGGAPIRSELAEFFDAIGICLVNGYGITECSPLISVNREYFNDFKSVGVLTPCLECRIDQPNECGEGEICVRGDSVMKGYYKNEEATAAVFDSEGWFHTGDYGRMNSKGQLYITGRKKNLIVLHNGKNIYPEEIEEYIKSIKYVEEVVVFSNRNESGEEVSLGAEVFLNEESVKGLDKNERKELIRSEIDRLNKKLPNYKNIITVRIRNKEFEKTTTRKIKRNDIGENLDL